jgi:hypothetical protein
MKERKNGRGRVVTIGWTNKGDDEPILDNGAKGIKM